MTPQPVVTASGKQQHPKDPSAFHRLPSGKLVPVYDVEDVDVGEVTHVPSPVSGFKFVVPVTVCEL